MIIKLLLTISLLLLIGCASVEKKQDCTPQKPQEGSLYKALDDFFKPRD